MKINGLSQMDPSSFIVEMKGKLVGFGTTLDWYSNTMGKVFPLIKASNSHIFSTFQLVKH
uniref:Uncharacterized protein n=1 Tax=Schistosoma japonicum TaxID=6182 RepID=Q5BVV9_SCHJA|nr:unknown [Schistosoma japonicum]